MSGSGYWGCRSVLLEPANKSLSLLAAWFRLLFVAIFAISQLYLFVVLQLITGTHLHQTDAQNVVRVAKRLVGSHPDIPAWRLRLALLIIAGSEGLDRDWNYGLLDLGALVCTSKSPKCEECPIQRHA